MKPLLLILALHYLLEVNGQESGSLPRSSPAKEQVSATAINKFLDEAATRKLELHSFMFLRHGKVMAEGWWNPYQPQLSHTM